ILKVVVINPSEWLERDAGVLGEVELAKAQLNGHSRMNSDFIQPHSCTQAILYGHAARVYTTCEKQCTYTSIINLYKTMHNERGE
ncbi:6693_t:CDS:2, partial [Acaulospora colombiana]